MEERTEIASNFSFLTSISMSSHRDVKDFPGQNAWEMISNNVQSDIFLSLCHVPHSGIYHYILYV